MSIKMTFARKPQRYVIWLIAYLMDNESNSFKRIQHAKNLFFFGCEVFYKRKKDDMPEALRKIQMANFT